MVESYRWEAERSAWIKSKRWPTLLKPGAMRRAEILARKARRIERAADGRAESAFHEAETKGLLGQWAKSDDSSTAMYVSVAFSLLVVIAVVYFGVTWLVSWMSFKLWEVLATQHRVRVWPYLVAAVVSAAFFLIARPLGLDLGLILGYAAVLESVTGGWIAPIELSGWYAAGWISWLEIQVVLGFVLSAWSAYAWGWAAPAVRIGSTHKRAERNTSGQAVKPRKDDDITKIISRSTRNTKEEPSNV